MFSYEVKTGPIYRVGREIPVVGIPSGNYREIPSWEILYILAQAGNTGDVINFFKVATTCQNKKIQIFYFFEQLIYNNHLTINS